MRKKRILAVLLSSAIAFSGMPGNVFAAEDVALEDGFSDGEEITEDVTEESVEDVRESVPEIDQGSEDFTGFSDGESEDFVAEEELEDETDPETQVFADAEGVVETGKCGDDLTYTITGDGTNGYTLTISGTGKMYDYYINKYAPWKSKNIINIIINSGVTTIGECAFEKCTNLTNIVIPEGITSIGGNAFDTCNKLENVVIPESVVKIGPYAFIDCKNLTNIIVPENVTRIEDGVFCGCLNMNDITIPKNVKYISNIAFLGCGLKVVKYTGTSEEWDAIGVIETELCKAKVYYNYDPNHTHVYEEQITKAATCTQAGEKTETCKFCGDALIKEIPATGHTVAINPAVEATCVQPGKTEGSHCSICGEVILEQKSVPALGHMWDEGTITKEPTCTENGEKTYTCSRCNEIKIERIAKIEHTIVVDSAIESTCTLVGKTEGKHCAVCGKIIQAQMNIPKIAHTIVVDPAIPATCTIPGKTEGSHCSVCGEVITPQKTIAKSGDHNWAREVVKAATCTTNGEVLWTCTLCGTKKTMEIIASGHRWGEWEVIKESTATEEGWQQRTCKICGMHDDEMIPKLSPAPTPTVDPINPSTVIITKGKTTILKPDSSWKNVKYSSSNKKVATVDKKGKVKAVAAGIAKITVKSGSESIVYTITVPGTTAIKGIKSSVSIKKGKRYTLKPKLSYTEKADKVTYKSSNKKIATVSKKGVIKGKKKGTATITIKSGKVTKKCKVKVK